MDQVDIAWVAGIIEGEGTFGYNGRKETTTSSKVQVIMTDEDIIRRLQSVTGMGRVSGPHGPYKPGYLPTWCWAIRVKRDLARIFLAIYPLLGERRREQLQVCVERSF